MPVVGEFSHLHLLMEEYAEMEMNEKLQRKLLTICICFSLVFEKFEWQQSVPQRYCIEMKVNYYEYDELAPIVDTKFSVN